MSEEKILAALDSLEARLLSRYEETHVLVERVASDQVELRAELAGVVARVEALEGARNSHDARLTAHERGIRDAVHAAKRVAGDMRTEIDGALAGVDARFADLAATVHETRDTAKRVELELVELRGNLDRAVLKALAAHVKSLEDAAANLARTPQVRTAASIGGAFAGSATVAIVIEVLKHI